ncbi:hypothetical protein D3C85_1307890 [compost metagenome]
MSASQVAGATALKAKRVVLRTTANKNNFFIIFFISFNSGQIESITTVKSLIYDKKEKEPVMGK